MLIDRYLPRFDVSEVHEVDVDAPPEVTYAAIREADLFTFGDVATPEMGWALLGETPGVEFVVGSVGRFWRRDYGWRSMPVEAFAAFEEPGYAKLAVSFRVEPHGANGSRFRYEARTATTDERSRAHFHRYWRIIHAGVAIVMRRALDRIRAEAERRHTAPAGAV